MGVDYLDVARAGRLRRINVISIRGRQRPPSQSLFQMPIYRTRKRDYTMNSQKTMTSQHYPDPHTGLRCGHTRTIRTREHAKTCNLMPYSAGIHHLCRRVLKPGRARGTQRTSAKIRAENEPKPGAGDRARRSIWSGGRIPPRPAWTWRGAGSKKAALTAWPP